MSNYYALLAGVEHNEEFQTHSNPRGIAAVDTPPNTSNPRAGGFTRRPTARDNIDDKELLGNALRNQIGALSKMEETKKHKKQKVLLMGKSGAGKSSMRSIIFSNYVPRDVRRLGATIDVEHSRVKFLGNLTLNLWDCGGQDAFNESYLTTQREYIFSEVAVLIYVFDIESREFERDLITYGKIIKALQEYGPSAVVFCLVHKMDLVQHDLRERIFDERVGFIREKSGKFDIHPYATSIWDQTLYKAWGGIVHTLVPNLNIIENYLRQLADVTNAEEIVLFESTTFLTVTSVTSKIGAMNPHKDRFEKLSNVIKTFKQTLSNHTGTPSSSPQINEWAIKLQMVTIYIARLTASTYVLVVGPPGEAEFNCLKVNVQIAKEDFVKLDLTGELPGRERGGGAVEGGRGEQGRSSG
ncbi:MAG: GTP-binding protein gtr1 [Pleopsidium flavum]|nr:MAG: GTP-binding protein gtr1 [Pleopsidium flavum]